MRTEKLKERVHLEDEGLDGRTILKWMFNKLFWGMGCIRLSHDRDKWRAIANAIINLRIP